MPPGWSIVKVRVTTVSRFVELAFTPEIENARVHEEGVALASVW